MRTTGQRLNEQQGAVQRMLNWWGSLLPALAAVEERVESLSAEVVRMGGDPGLEQELTGLRDLLARVARDVPDSEA